jgi:BirA family transcriptional regulator, biotin operon repressor / biotin---[acetyl-CoA-carboxylase] ligase
VPSPDPQRPPLDLSVPPGPGWRVEVLEESPSTNAYVAQRARAGEAPGLVVVAEHQTAGRGRLDRSWTTPARAALTLSLLVSPGDVPAARWPWLPLLTGLAVVDGLRRSCDVAASLKWPNDVLVGDLKVAGLLVERVDRPGGPVAVVGIGVNVSTTRAELPVETATSLLLAGAGEVDRSALLRAVLESFASWYDGWRAVGGRAGQRLRPSYVAACSTLGRLVRVEMPTGGALEGRAVGVDDAGRLRVDDGTRVHVLGVGDVVHVRAGLARG